MSQQTLDQMLNAGVKMGFIPLEVMPYIHTNLNSSLNLRQYQIEALGRFTYVSSNYQERKLPTQLLFHMATGSGKTLIMAGCILQLYNLGYRNFIFFVNSSTIIEKTRDNFLNSFSPKYLFNEEISFFDRRVRIREVENFQTANKDDINIVFSTIQGLHTKLNSPRENSLTFDDFDNNKIVLISDEAHHVNAETKKGKLNKEESASIYSWENTVKRIFSVNENNFLLEFTATADLSNPLIEEKYRDKLIFDYPLKQFREDKYSKEVKVLQAELEPFSRSLQAVLLSQYRRKIFEKNGLSIKPVILLKSKTIAESQAFFKLFIKSMQKLKEKDLIAIRDLNSDNIIQEIFYYFDQNSITISNLIEELKDDFSENKCIVVDSKSDSEQKQLILNNLEAKDNEYRAVFAVDKLNEGWDVLNLFDIVRLYNTRDASKINGKIGKTTMSEAQLIGRGARYCPFRTSIEQPFDQRKFDQDTSNHLRVCEELYYHSAYNPKYISELNKALVRIGIKDSSTRELPLTLKEKFKKTDFFKKGMVFTNKRVVDDRMDVTELDINIRDKERRVKLHTGFNTVSYAFENITYSTSNNRSKVYSFKDFSLPLKRKALSKLQFYRFNNLLIYFPHLSSINEFILSDKYLNLIRISLIGTENQVNNPSSEMVLQASVFALDDISKEIRSGYHKFKGTTSFYPQSIEYTFKDKILNITVGEGNAEKGIPQSLTHDLNLRLDLGLVDWYAFNENYGTDQEKYFVKYLDQVYKELNRKYEEIYLLRNEKHFKIYAFDDGRPFEPDFVLFLKKDSESKSTFYQIFVEPKGQQYLQKDLWKEEFLKEIEDKYRIDTLFENKDFKLIGLPFFNEELRKVEFEGAISRI